MTGAADPRALLRLQSWLSPAFPVGAFSYSHALESAADLGWVRDRDTMIDWLEADLRHGAGRNDAILAAAAWRAETARDDDALAEAAELSAVLRGTGEFALESGAQGAAFLRTVRQAWPHRRLEDLTRTLNRARVGPTLPIIYGVSCAAHGIGLDQALPLFLQAAAANLVSAGLRILPIGQTDGQHAIMALEDAVMETAIAAAAGDLDEIGSSAAMVDIASLAHETQYTRLFRS